MKVKIKAGEVSIEAEIFDNRTGKKIFKSLPFTKEAQVWGKEIYFKIPLHLELDESASSTVSDGELGFWPSGDCFCIFFGQQPVSAVNVFGKVIGDSSILNEVRNGEKITVQKC